MADSFAALELHCCEKKDLSWDQVRNAIAVNFEGPEADAVRRILKNTPMYGYGGTEADGWAGSLRSVSLRSAHRKDT